MLKQNIAGESQAGRGSQKNSGGCYKGRRKVPALGGRGRDQWGHKKPEMQQFWGHFEGAAGCPGGKVPERFQGVYLKLAKGFQGSQKGPGGSQQSPTKGPREGFRGFKAGSGLQGNIVQAPEPAQKGGRPAICQLRAPDPPKR